MEVPLAGTGTGAELDGDSGGSCLSRRGSDLGNNVIFRNITLCPGGTSDGPYQYAYAQDDPNGNPHLFRDLCQEGNNKKQGVQSDRPAAAPFALPWHMCVPYSW
ncbi:hypothetical protein D3C77_674620 [compost metagenome]